MTLPTLFSKVTRKEKRKNIHGSVRAGFPDFKLSDVGIPATVYSAIFLQKWFKLDKAIIIYNAYVRGFAQLLWGTKHLWIKYYCVMPND